MRFIKFLCVVCYFTSLNAAQKQPTDLFSLLEFSLSTSASPKPKKNKALTQEELKLMVADFMTSETFLQNIYKKHSLPLDEDDKKRRHTWNELWETLWKGKLTQEQLEPKVEEALPLAEQLQSRLTVVQEFFEKREQQKKPTNFNLSAFLSNLLTKKVTP